jgi:hypothetical protein
VIPHQIIFSFFFILPIVNTVSTNYSFSYLFLFPFPFFLFPIIVLISSGSSLITRSCFRNRFISSANRFGIVWHPAASDKETSCQSSSVRLTQVGLCLIRSMALSGAFRPLGGWSCRMSFRFGMLGSRFSV